MFFSPATLQPKLEIGQPDDPYEKEADRVADQVMMMSNQGIQLSQGGDVVQRQPLVQRVSSRNSGKQTASPKITSKVSTIRGSGNPLPKNIQNEMGGKIGADFSYVKIHTDNTAAQLSQNLRARAFTVGNDIYFNKGQYNPNSREGKRLMAHELTHVVQQQEYEQEMIQRALFRRQRIFSGSKTLGPGISLSWRGNSVRITAQLEVYGPEASENVAQQIEDTIDNYWNESFDDGYAVNTDVDVSYREESDDEDSNRTQIYVTDLRGPSNVRRRWLVGSRYMRYDIDADINWTPAHEFGHLIGLSDRYSESVISKISGRMGGERTNEVETGWENNIMAVHGGDLERRNIEDLLETHATEIVTIVEDTIDEIGREYRQMEDYLRRGGNPFF